MASKWSPGTPVGAAPIDPDLADLRAALQRQFQATAALVEQSRQAVKIAKESNAGLLKRLARRLTPRSMKRD